MIPAPLRIFIGRLIRATDDVEIVWREGAEGAYFATQKDANFHLRYHFDEDTGVSIYNFRIFRKSNDAFFSVNSEETDFETMRRLYESVSVNSAGGQNIVDDLFD